MKILVVSYYFTWSASVGSRRTSGLVRGLATEGHDITVIGAAPPDGRRTTPLDRVMVIETPPCDRVLSARSAWARIRPSPGQILDNAADTDFDLDGDRADHRARGRASTWTTSARAAVRTQFRQWVSFPDTMWGWHRAARRALPAQLQPDLIIASAPPMAGLRAAAKLSNRFGCPWIADMRDLWTGDPNRRVPRVLERLDSFVERDTLSSASAITTVAASLAGELHEKFPSIPITTLRNGFDDSWLRVGDDPPAPGAPIVYTGTLTANTGRSIDELCDIAAGMRETHRGGTPITHIDVYGAVDPAVPHLIGERNLNDVIRLQGIAGAHEVRAAQHGAAALLNLSWESPRDVSNLPAKLFEYAAARRPVLHLGRVETLGTQLIRDHRLGFVRNPADTSAVIELITQLAANTSGWVPPEPRELAALSQSAMIDGFRQVINATMS